MVEYLFHPIICGSTDDWGVTKVNEDSESCIFYWTIPSFSSYERCDVNKIFESRMFFGLNNGKCVWRLLLYPNGRGNETADKRYLSVYLVFEFSNDDNLREIGISEVQFIVRNSNLAVVSSKSFKNGTMKVGQTVGVTLLKKQKKNSRILLTDMLTIECRLSGKKMIKLDLVPRLLFPAVEKQRFTFLISEKFKHLIKTACFDIFLTCRSQEFKAHQAVLAARCPRFFSQLKQRMEERGGRQIYLSFIAPEVLKELLHFIYTDEAPKIEVMPRELLAMAENYGLEDLKKKCELVLIKRITVGNIYDILSFAEINNAEELKNYAKEFAEEYAKKIAKANRGQT